MDDSLLIFLTINTSFIDATLTLYRISTSRLLQTTKL